MQRIFIFIIIIFCSSCKSCDRIYGVHEELSPLRIVVNKEVGSVESFKKFIDSVNQSITDSCHYTSISTDKNDVIVCTSNPKCECYLISVEKNKLTIPAVFVPSITAKFWLTKEEQISDSLLVQVKENLSILLNRYNN
jgi:hypothetical protein